jgi:phage gpG-like protein
MPRGFAVQLDVKGLENARRIARRVRNLGEDPTPLLHIAGSVLESSTLRRFDTGRGVGGVPWPKSKRALRDGGKTLVDRGDLVSSVRFEVRPGEVEIGVDDLNKPPGVSAALQFGSHRQTVVLAHTRTINQAFGVPLPSPREVRVRAHGRMTNLPPRPFIGVDAQDKRDITEEWLGHLRRLLNG